MMVQLVSFSSKKPARPVCKRRILFSILLVLCFIGVFPRQASATQASNSTFLASENRYFTVYYREENVRLAAILSADSDSFARRFCGELGLRKPARPIPVYIDPSNKGKSEVFPSPRWVNGFFEPGKRIIVIKTARQLGRGAESEILTVFRHEAVHAILHDNIPRIPRWLDEGLAQSFSRGFTINDGRTLLGLPVKHFRQLMHESAFQKESTAKLAYPLSCGLVSYLRELGRPPLTVFLKRLKNMDMETAFDSAYGIHMSFFFYMFLENYLSRYTLLNLIVSDEGLFGLMTLLAVVLLLVQKVRNRRKLRRLGEEDEEEYKVEVEVEPEPEPEPEAEFKFGQRDD
ncbi:MAG: hypothetical protein CO090_10385 [Acidobacteria bacterium CG_4_9_14_3_um_filter_49_7]|nr:MAG: hypothetical protein CO090_10385 [Acidobacteria bacterium CG_4_9_14_3_um_filter_49_7]